MIRAGLLIALTGLLTVPAAEAQVRHPAHDYPTATRADAIRLAHETRWPSKPIRWIL